MNKAQFREVYDKVCKAVDKYKDLYVLAGVNKDITILYPDILTGVHVWNIVGEALKDYDCKMVKKISDLKIIITFN